MHTIRIWLSLCFYRCSWHRGRQRAPSGVPVTDFVVPYTSYTYDYWGAAGPAPHAYLPVVRDLRGDDLGVGPLETPTIST